MKNFDATWDAETEEERTFQVRGETFVLRQAVTPEAMAEKLAAMDAVREDPDTNIADVMRVADEFILLMIEPDGGGADAEGRWRALRARTDGGLNAAHIQTIQKWVLEMQMGMVEEETGRPPTSPPGSSRGSRKGATSSTDSSSSPALQAV